MARRPSQNLALVIGLVLLGTAIGPEILTIGARGFGALQQIFAVFGLGAIVVGALPRSSYIARGSRQLIIGLALLYGFLILCELGMLVLTPHQYEVDPAIGLRGSIVDAPWGFNLKPGWKGAYDDGIISGQINVNAHGDRDDPPRNDHPRRILIIGDSIAFGQALDQTETIDTHIERISEGQFDAYNLGVPGFGPAEVAEKLSATTSTRVEHIFYIFSGNDLRDDARRGAYRAFSGYLVPAFKPDGQPYDEMEYAANAQDRAEDTTLKKVLALVGVRWILGEAMSKDGGRVLGSIDDYKPEGITHALRQTERMAEVAKRWGAGFTVIIVPMKGEAHPGSYSWPTGRFIGELDRVGIPFEDIHRHLRRKRDYIGHARYLSPNGARKTAMAILDKLSK